MKCKPVIICQDWDKASVPLKATGAEPKFVKPPDKFSGTEGENLFTTIEVTGDPIPEIEWFRVSIFFYILLSNVSNSSRLCGIRWF